MPATRQFLVRPRFPATIRSFFTYHLVGKTGHGLTFPAGFRPIKGAMTLRDLFHDVLRTLWAHKLRAFLTMFGIAWGIVSIVLMVAAGEGLRKGQAEQARNLGKDVMIVFHGRTSLQAGGTHAGRQVHWVANTPFQSWSRIRCARTATSIMPRLR